MSNPWFEDKTRTEPTNDPGTPINDELCAKYAIFPHVDPDGTERETTEE